MIDQLFGPVEFDDEFERADERGGTARDEFAGSESARREPVGGTAARRRAHTSRDRGVPSQTVLTGRFPRAPPHDGAPGCRASHGIASLAARARGTRRRRRGDHRAVLRRRRRADRPHAVRRGPAHACRRRRAHRARAGRARPRRVPVRAAHRDGTQADHAPRRALHGVHPLRPGGLDGARRLRAQPRPGRPRLLSPPRATGRRTSARARPATEPWSATTSRSSTAPTSRAPHARGERFPRAARSRCPTARSARFRPTQWRWSSGCAPRAARCAGSTPRHARPPYRKLPTTRAVSIVFDPASGALLGTRFTLARGDGPVVDDYGAVYATEVRRRPA